MREIGADREIDENEVEEELEIRSKCSGEGKTIELAVIYLYMV